MAYDSKAYEDEMRRFDAKMRSRGVSVSSYGGIAVVETPKLGPRQMLIDRESRTILVGERAHFEYVMKIRQMRIDARAELEEKIAALARWAGVDEVVPNE